MQLLPIPHLLDAAETATEGAASTAPGGDQTGTGGLGGVFAKLFAQAQLTETSPEAPAVPVENAEDVEATIEKLVAEAAQSLSAEPAVATVPAPPSTPVEKVSVKADVAPVEPAESDSATPAVSAKIGTPAAPRAPGSEAVLATPQGTVTKPEQAQTPSAAQPAPPQPAPPPTARQPAADNPKPAPPVTPSQAEPAVTVAAESAANKVQYAVTPPRAEAAPIKQGPVIEAAAQAGKAMALAQTAAAQPVEKPTVEATVTKPIEDADNAFETVSEHGRRQVALAQGESSPNAKPAQQPVQPVASNTPVTTAEGATQPAQTPVVTPTVQATATVHAQPAAAPPEAAPVTSTIEALPETAVKSVRYLASTQGDHTVRVRLVPESLGEVRIEVTSNDRGMAVRLASDNGHVRNVLEGHAAGLRDALIQQGGDAARVSVTVDAGTSHGNAPQDGRAQATANPENRSNNGSQSNPDRPGSNPQQRRAPQYGDPGRTGLNVLA